MRKWAFIRSFRVVDFLVTFRSDREKQTGYKATGILVDLTDDKISSFTDNALDQEASKTTVVHHFSVILVGR